MRKYTWILLILCLSTNPLWAQRPMPVVSPLSEHVSIVYVRVSASDIVKVSGIDATSVALRFSNDPDQAYLQAGGKKHLIQKDEHVQSTYMGSSNLIVFDKAVKEFSLYTGALSGDLEIVLINARASAKAGAEAYQNTREQTCAEPNMVEQSVWRAGLPSPNYGRSFSKTENLIIHHSATSNDLTDYTNIVRNIYLYHTQSNGWSDIGYNYLIAPDGTIFKGRDPDTGEQDKVIGAHFCGSNSATMGVCLMGTFTDVPPTDEAIQALIDLLAWKTSKDGLDPQGQHSHPLNTALPVIAGHRDGCSTECPGQQTYNRLSTIRLATADKETTCDEGKVYTFELFPNPAKSYAYIKLLAGDTHELRLYSARGEMLSLAPEYTEEDEVRIPLDDFAAGIYFLNYQSAYKLIKRKLVIIK